MLKKAKKTCKQTNKQKEKKKEYKASIMRKMRAKEAEILVSNESKESRNSSIKHRCITMIRTFR